MSAAGPPVPEHGFKVYAPWYVCERGGFDRFDPRARTPALQKYDSAEFVRRLVTDPRDSLRFDAAEDVWSYAVPVPLGERGPGRARFATHQLVRTGLRKLYQPAHDRFYAFTVELFCDRPGLPRPQSPDGLEVGFVMRRRQVEMTAPPRVLRKLAHRLTADLLAAQNGSRGEPSVHGSEVEDVLWADLAQRLRFASDHRELLDQVGLRTQTQAWMTGGAGGQWRALGTPPPKDRPADRELELPMWRLPARSGDCTGGGSGPGAPPERSLWFGVVPTASGDHDDLGLPRLDEHHVYELRCFVRRPARPGHGHCPRQTSWSEPGEPFRLAAFFDPEGTKNRRISLTLPDLRAVAARAGGPPGPGGVAVTSPPGSQLSFDPGGGTPSGGTVGGSVPRTCTFALEIFMIVAFFLFSMFLPIVVFLFQLWWLLALRFCLPPSLSAVAALKTFFDGGGKLSTMGPAERARLDELLGSQGAAARLQESGAVQDEHGGDLLTALTPPPTVPLPAQPRPEPPVDDPLCGGG
ncbi:hypothetical protein [Streptomyces sp. NBC_01408]|uniref:hypothetical protein n=1 Tax=Streptomyces sp. NBC_01408 TaxID=2903855 RepID=UPI002253C5E5|nr:hypothetical protein [Streptomyces sp. NBC_01408]MCX4695764.1 hypothetical protein [Streptomyces sp. NBC_01408]